MNIKKISYLIFSLCVLFYLGSSFLSDNLNPYETAIQGNDDKKSKILALFKT